ncbi:lectin-like domain-containing protein [Rufibacter latericius]|uniref:Ig-like domain-containing protein n=1 Tax=Rufibacter latericius TaxID=2487040 RepID=A0A3M9N0S7_9BACT|nr:gliding motility-associated C-terminal domain-containing protein [Rufibacter latericius]RNI31007.1 hypothetical protein EFB08_00235 [Rufibacter latericius]
MNVLYSTKQFFGARNLKTAKNQWLIPRQVVWLLFSLLSSLPGYSQFVTRGDSAPASTTCYRITPDQPARFGTIWWKDKIDLTKPFEVSFIIFLGSKDQSGADGIAFLFHNDPRGFEARGNSGSGLGFGVDEFDNANRQSISPSVAIEFDTYDNGVLYHDIPEDHTAVIYNGIMDRPKVLPVRLDPDNVDVENNQCHTYKITWNPATKELQLFFDGKQRFSHRDDLIQTVFSGSKEVYYGFTGSTGGLQNEQTICIIDPESKPVAQDDVGKAEPLKPVSLPVLENDSHTKQEPIGLTKVMTAPKNGTAIVSNNQIVYTANRGFSGTDTFVYEVCENASGQCYSKCATASVTMQVSCPVMPPPELKANAALEICAGDKLQLTVTSGENYLYQWRKDGQPTGGLVTTNILEVKEKGMYSVEVFNACGTKLSSNQVAVSVRELPLAPAVTSATRCGPGSVTLQASSSTADAYRWYDSPSATIPIASATSSTFNTPEVSGSTTFYASVVQNGCESPRVPVEVIIKPLPMVQAGADVTINLGQSTQLHATGGVSFRWEPALGLSDASSPAPKAQPRETTTYTVTAKDDQGCENRASVTITVTKNLVIPTAFSPNGDGTNEVWEITNITSYPDATLRIFDRWGGSVFETKGYGNNWNGTQKGKPLPVGTYFYHINLEKGRTLTGAVSIVR